MEGCDGGVANASKCSPSPAHSAARCRTVQCSTVQCSSLQKAVKAAGEKWSGFAGTFFDLWGVGIACLLVDRN